jgi:hypothetical protein
MDYTVFKMRPLDRRGPARTGAALTRSPAYIASKITIHFTLISYLLFQFGTAQAILLLFLSAPAQAWTVPVFIVAGAILPLCWYARGTSVLVDEAGAKSGASATDDCQTPTCWRLVATRDMTNSVPVYPSTVREVKYQVTKYRNIC